jgi:hypothetical protein
MPSVATMETCDTDGEESKKGVLYDAQRLYDLGCGALRVEAYDEAADCLSKALEIRSVNFERAFDPLLVNVNIFSADMIEGFLLSCFSERLVSWILTSSFASFSLSLPCATSSFFWFWVPCELISCILFQAFVLQTFVAFSFLCKPLQG